MRKQETILIFISKPFKLTVFDVVSFCREHLPSYFSSLERKTKGNVESIFETNFLK